LFNQTLATSEVQLIALRVRPGQTGSWQASNAQFQLVRPSVRYNARLGGQVEPRRSFSSGVFLF
jgi:hypothetical protein